MNLVKKLLITALTFSLVVGCSKPEDTKISSDTKQTSTSVEENKSEKKCGESKAEKKCGDSKAEKKCGDSKAEKKCGDSKAEKKCGDSKAEKKCGDSKAEKKCGDSKSADKVKVANAEAAKVAQEAAAAAKAEAAKVAQEAAAAAEAEAAKVAKEAAAAAEIEAAKVAKEAAAAAEIEAAKIAEETAAAAKAEAEKIAQEAATKASAAVAAAPAFDMSNVDLGDKTPIGAQKSGNASGTIPAWTGGITKPPAGYKQGDHHQDPFASDKVLFTIDASNYKDYADNLSVGQKAMFDKYPDTYKMNVYKTRRSASFPQRIYQKTIENAKTGKLISNGEGVSDVSEGFPFPNAENAYELMWNHKLKYKGSGGVRYNNQVAPTATGRYTVVKLKEELLGKYYTEGNTIADIDNILLYFYQVVESPARLAGRILLVHETMDQTKQPRQAWIYNPGQRRVRRAPNVAYDNPGTASDGLRTNDMTDMFNGAMDRFDWKVVGKKEMYVPYNSYKVHSGDLDYSDIVKPGHLNQDLMRYEVHRMYVVEATLKEGVRHINSRRTYYLDEDSYQILLTDHYDKRGNIWRFSEAHSINYYDVPTFWSTVESHHDLRSGRYVALGLDNKDPVNTFNVPLSEANYTPQALRKRGRR